MKLLIIYYSKTGFTRRYAQWLQEDLACDCVTFQQAKQMDFSPYDELVFGSSVRAGKIQKLKWLQGQLPKLEGKRITVFFTGAMAPDPERIKQCIDQNFTPQQQKKMKVFYLWGGLNYDKMSGLDKWMMGVFRKMLAAKKKPSQEDQQAAEMVASSFDKTQRENLEPLKAYLVQ